MKLTILLIIFSFFAFSNVQGCREKIYKSVPTGKRRRCFTNVVKRVPNGRRCVPVRIPYQSCYNRRVFTGRKCKKVNTTRCYNTRANVCRNIPAKVLIGCRRVRGFWKNHCYNRRYYAGRSCKPVYRKRRTTQCRRSYKTTYNGFNQCNKCTYVTKNVRVGQSCKNIYRTKPICYRRWTSVKCNYRTINRRICTRTGRIVRRCTPYIYNSCRNTYANKRVCLTRYRNKVRNCYQQVGGKRVNTCQRCFTVYRNIKKTTCKFVYSYRQLAFYRNKCVRQCPNVPLYYDKNAYYLPQRDRRTLALQYCRHSNLNIYYSCVYDAAHGVQKAKEEYDRAATLAGGIRTCSSLGDPHILTFYGRRLDYYRPGTRLLFRKGDVSITTQVGFTRRWRNRGVNKAVTVRFGRTTTYFNRPTGSPFRPNWANSFREFRGGKRYSNDWQVKNVGFRGIVRSKTYIKKYKNYIVTVDVSQQWINVYLKGIGSISTVRCSGDCCASGGRYGRLNKRLVTVQQIYQIKFKPACFRKSKRLQECTRLVKGRRNVLKCLRKQH